MAGVCVHYRFRGAELTTIVEPQHSLGGVSSYQSQSVLDSLTMVLSSVPTLQAMNLPSWRMRWRLGVS